MWRWLGGSDWDNWNSCAISLDSGDGLAIGMLFSCSIAPFDQLFIGELLCELMVEWGEEEGGKDGFVVGGEKFSGIGRVKALYMVR